VFLGALGLAAAGVATSSAREASSGRETAVNFVDSLPLYVPEQKASGTISMWGHGSFKHDFLGKLVQAWTEGFRRLQPEVQFENRMYGTASAIGAISPSLARRSIRPPPPRSNAQRAIHPRACRLPRAASLRASSTTLT